MSLEVRPKALIRCSTDNVRAIIVRNKLARFLLRIFSSFRNQTSHLKKPSEMFFT